ncbi:MAG: peptidylprolyl isomerase [Ruminococcus sp.]|nr:peptidylprolyl isomerase [Ruminococcus sp.]
MLKKISAITLSFIIAAMCFAGCGDSSSSESSATSAADSSVADSSSSADSSANGDASSAADDSSTQEEVIPEASLTIDGEKVDTKDLVMLTVDGRDIDFDTFRYYYAYVLNVYGVSPDAVTEDIFKDILANTVNQIKQEYVTLKIADEEKITLDDEDKKTIENDIATIKGQYESEEAFIEGMKKYYLTIDVLNKMEEMSALYKKVYSTVLTNGGKYATKAEDFKKVVQDKDQYARAIHILIPYCSQAPLDDETAKTFDSMELAQKMNIKQQAYAQLTDEKKQECKDAAKKIAEDVLKKALDGEDFKELIKEYGWDAGMENEDYKDGYYIRPQSQFVQEFKDAAFSLKENEITKELVENESYGYFIIKRLPVDLDYVDSHINMLTEEYDKDKIQDLYKKLMDEMEVTYSDTYNKLTYNSIT